MRSRSFYVSKMIAATTVGLFDAALNYLWEEPISELRRRVVGCDVKYVFDITAGENNDLRKILKTEDDLSRIDDSKLLQAAFAIGLLTDVGSGGSITSASRAITPARPTRAKSCWQNTLQYRRRSVHTWFDDADIVVRTQFR